MTVRDHRAYVAACVLMVLATITFFCIAMPALLRSVGA